MMDSHRPVTHSIAVVCLTAVTLPMARKIAEILRQSDSQPTVTLYGKNGRVCATDVTGFDSTPGLLQKLFGQGQTILAVCAAGIVIRALAPLLTGDDSGHKSEQPAVLVVAADGSAVVPLLGGHGGLTRHGFASGNVLARYLAARLTHSQAAITTASELADFPVFDDPPAGWSIEGYGHGSPMVALLLRDLVVAALAGAMPRLSLESGNGNWLKLPASDQTSEFEILVTHRSEASQSLRLVYHPPVLALGLGGVRGVKAESAIQTIDETLAAHGLSMESVAILVSHQIKSDEAGFIELAAHYNKPLRYFSPAELLAETDRLGQRSEAVFAATGCYGVAEGAALAAVGRDGKLLLPKTISRDGTLTLAVAMTAAGSEITQPQTIGRPRGKLTVVGIGPGRRDWLTPAVLQALQTAEVVVGYGLYLEQIADIIAGKQRFDSPLGAESARAAAAIDFAAAGRTTVLVSSGDAGIYGLAALVFEQLESNSDPQIARIEVLVEPGISAVQAAAARLGAAIGHDFVTISLSDLLTPWAVIEQRLSAAAAGDFVVALYNPRSQNRDWQLPRAMEILAQNRPADTPVAIARNLGREAESVTVTGLAEFDPTLVDMFSLVLIGNSQSRGFKFGGKDWLLTPRGYAAKGLK
ncbi:MAG: precorrin-3B C(17)-methyltransferase [Candidatus Pacebacteria bacterium]|nr:precorrin-3B C(17)-methyltransferase [Candidatus Paceibacterota bacterium]